MAFSSPHGGSPPGGRPPAGTSTLNMRSCSSICFFLFCRSLVCFASSSRTCCRCISCCLDCSLFSPYKTTDLRQSTVASEIAMGIYLNFTIHMLQTSTTIISPHKIKIYYPTNNFHRTYIIGNCSFLNIDMMCIYIILHIYKYIHSNTNGKKTQRLYTQTNMLYIK